MEGGILGYFTSVYYIRGACINACIQMGRSRQTIMPPKRVSTRARLVDQQQYPTSSSCLLFFLVETD